MNTSLAGVAELQGLYGAYSFSEHLLQKIWLRGDFDRTRAMTVDGVPVEILHPGQWNRLGGPDFRSARIRLANGGEAVGDVELHLRAEDWDAHKHAEDPAYARVILHVVLFPPKPGRETLGAGGHRIPVLPLLALLHHDLEEFAADEAVERLAARPTARIVEELGGLAPMELAAKLRGHAEARWKQKVHFARLRVQRLGWTTACHQTALEVLGYRFNRAPMLRLAGRFPLEEWARGELTTEALLAAESWSLQGVRPANHPRIRLKQYAGWAKARPNWPEVLRQLAETIPTVPVDQPTAHMRRDIRLGSWRERIRVASFAEAVGGSRADTLIVDGFFPLMAATHAQAPLFGCWFHWFPGDLPPLAPRALRDLGLAGQRQQPATNGYAQGLLGWWWQREAESVTSAGRGA